MKSKFLFYSFLASILMLVSCDKYLGDKTDLDFIEVPQQSYREVAYVPVQPILDGFGYPVDIITGFDELIYIVDSLTQEVVAMDESGRLLSRKTIQGAKAIAQDRRLNLLVIGTKTDTLGVTRDCIYRLNLSGAGGYGLQYATITNEIVHPFYYKQVAIGRDSDVSLNRVSILGDNSFYVSRSGDKNNPNQPGGPDDAILFFDRNDNFITPIAVNSSLGGFSRDFFKKPFGITTLAKYPQISVDTRGDFIYTSLAANGALKVQYIENQSSVDGNAYVAKTDWANDTSLASSFINIPFRFEEPSGVEFTGDGSNYIFIVDKAKDSLYQFTSTGLEGVQPPPASGEKKFVYASFGGTGNGASQFNQPTAVAYKRRVVYVADGGNGRILRFKLTVDIQ